jgi:PAS domain S-box-containing protein
MSGDANTPQTAHAMEPHTSDLEQALREIEAIASGALGEPNGVAEERLLAAARTLAARASTAEQRADDLAERYDLVMRAADDGLWDWNLLTDELFLSARWKEMLGFSPDELENNPEEWRSRIHPDDLDRSLTAVRDYLERRSPVYELDHRLRHRDGTYRWISSRGTALWDGQGRAYRFAGAHWDITDRRLYQQRLRDRERQYRAIFEAAGDAMLITELEGGIIIEANPAASQLYGYTHDEFIGLHPSVIIHPDEHAGYNEVLSAIRAGRGIRRRARNVRMDGTPLHVEVRASPFLYGGRLHMLGVLRDITSQVEASRVLEQRVDERTRELATMLEVSKTLTSTLELRPLLRLILDQLHIIADYTSCAITTVEGNEFVNREYRGPLPTELVLRRRMSVPVDDPVWDEFRRREPVIIDDVWGDSSGAATLRLAMGDEYLRTTASYIRAWMAVPFVHNGVVAGTITLTHQQPGHFTQRHATLAAALANQAAIAIENARLYEQAQQVAVLEERQRLARELHDSVSQALFGIGLGAKTARTLLERGQPERALKSIDYVLSLSETGTAEMKALIFELRPESLQSEGLVAALTKQLAALHARYGLHTEVDLPDEPDVPLDVKEALYRIGQEAMHNTVKHAQAHALRVRLAHDPNVVTLEVHDDGAGFDPGGAFPGHLGLRSMRERASRLGGTLSIDSAPGRGSSVRVAIPATAH